MQVVFKKMIQAGAVTAMLYGFSNLASASAPICTYYPPEEWKSMDEISAYATQQGEEKFFVQPEAGCWAIYSKREGKEWRILLDPKSGEKIREGYINY